MSSTKQNTKFDKVLMLIAEYSYSACDSLGMTMSHQQQREFTAKLSFIVNDIDGEVVETYQRHDDVPISLFELATAIRPIGEDIIKADAILSAWLNYCRESRIYRILEFFGLR